MPRFGLTGVHIRGFRSLKDASFRPGTISAIVGEPSTGKSNLLTAIWALLDPDTAPLVATDLAEGGQGPIRVVGELADGSTISVEGAPPGRSSVQGAARPHSLFFPAGLRDGPLVAPPGRAAVPHPVAELLHDAVDRDTTSSHGTPTASARGLVAGLESWS
ncbi:MAG TPA: hypothetical protein VGZ51_06010, partial [Actinomycetota bacterium]|nr:hypothetical protein [Actinomycetota bacterium]